MVGFCLGGGMALLLAPDRGFGAESVNYGTAPKDAYTSSFIAGACPILGSYGGKDRALRGAAARLEAASPTSAFAHDVKENPDAAHAFINHDGAGDKTPLLFAILGKLSPGDGYHEPSARDTRRRIIAFLDTYLKAQPPAAPRCASGPGSTR